MNTDRTEILWTALETQGITLPAELVGMVPARSWEPVLFWGCFARIRRHTPAAALIPDPGTASRLRQIYAGFSVRYWDLRQLVRAWLMTTIPASQAKTILTPLIEHGDLREQQAVFRGLPLVANAGAFSDQVALGVRTNMLDVFQAIALDNPLPSQLLDDAGWAQVVLKAIFMDQPLYRIYDLDRRKSLPLALTAVDYAAERWAAGRTACPELWRLVQGFDHPEIQRALQRAGSSRDPLTAEAAGLAMQPVSDATAWRTLGVTYASTRTSNDAHQVLYPAPKMANPSGAS